MLFDMLEGPDHCPHAISCSYVKSTCAPVVQIMKEKKLEFIALTAESVNL